METTARKAEELTEKGSGKHHIGDFLPPDELQKFMEKVGLPTLLWQWVPGNLSKSNWIYM